MQGSARNRTDNLRSAAYNGSDGRLSGRSAVTCRSTGKDGMLKVEDRMFKTTAEVDSEVPEV